MDEAALQEWGKRTEIYTADLKSLLCPVVEKHMDAMQQIIKRVLEVENVHVDEFKILRLTLNKEEIWSADIHNLGARIFQAYSHLRDSKKPEFNELEKQWLVPVQELKGQMEEYRKKYDIPENFDSASMRREQREANKKYDLGSDGSFLGIEHHSYKGIALKYNENVRDNGRPR